MGTTTSDREPVPELPECFYDEAWLESKDEEYLTSVLHVSKEHFKWLDRIEERGVANKGKGKGKSPERVQVTSTSTSSVY